MMKEHKLESKWHKVKGKFKQKYANLTEKELSYQEGRFEEMIGNLVEKTGKSEKEIMREIKDG
ncbi:CsbD family protein [Mesonia aquimarina]|uniref:CsbD family protein n=1 Tax=Mesonia aquimarina TaxID=1504967 RepID=UPI002936F38C|nr:CsbD family protein [Mesonia aquimarina]